MDPVTQGTVGALATAAVSKPKQLAKAALIGGVSGMTPDLDVLISSAHDPLLAIEYHRHFTHSLFFVPFGAMICALIAYFLVGRVWRLSFAKVYLWCFVGYGTHALLDACTSYGTQLLWPLSTARVAWDIIAVVDFAFTLPILLLIVLAIMRKRKGFLAGAAVWGACYLALGLFQHYRALDAGMTLASYRDHQVSRIVVKPSFSNLLVWKVIYESDGVFYVDAVRPMGSKTLLWEGGTLTRFYEEQLPWLDKTSQQAKDIQRFSWFSDGFIGLSPSRPDSIVDIRYSMIPNRIEPLWGIALRQNAGADDHVDYFTQRQDPMEAIRVLAIMAAGGGDSVLLSSLR